MCRKIFPLDKGKRRDQIIHQIIELMKMLVLAGVPVDEVDIDQA